MEILRNPYHTFPLPGTHPLAQQGRAHILHSVFMAKDRKERLLNEYPEPWLVQNNQCEMCIFLPRNKKPDKDLISLMLGRIHFMRKLVKNNKPLLIWIWPTPWKKTLPPKNKPFTESMINSGSTSLYVSGPKSRDNGEICLWREEEILKVLVHELIHSFRLDERDPVPREAYVELRAVKANAMLELLERRLPLSWQPSMIQQEQLYGLNQARRANKYKPGRTNIRAYLNERNRLLTKMPKKEWTEKVNEIHEDNPGYDLPKKSLRFTITDKILDREGHRKVLD